MKDKAAKDDMAASSAKSNGNAAAKVGAKADTKGHKKSRVKAADEADEKVDVNADKSAANSSRSNNQKVTLCHRTNSDHNPYVRITVSINSVIKSSGHDGHNGPVYAAEMKSAHQKWGDIIPASATTAVATPARTGRPVRRSSARAAWLPAVVHDFADDHHRDRTPSSVGTTQSDPLPPHELRPQPLRADHRQHQQRDQELWS